MFNILDLAIKRKDKYKNKIKSISINEEKVNPNFKAQISNINYHPSLCQKTIYEEPQIPVKDNKNFEKILYPNTQYQSKYMMFPRPTHNFKDSNIKISRYLNSSFLYQQQQHSTNSEFYPYINQPKNNSGTQTMYTNFNRQRNFAQKEIYQNMLQENKTTTVHWRPSLNHGFSSYYYHPMHCNMTDLNLTEAKISTSNIIPQIKSHSINYKNNIKLETSSNNPFLVKNRSHENSNMFNVYPNL